jgi:hypothetical protein
LGFLYLLGLPALNITNVGAVLIMLYIPISLVIGIAAEELFQTLMASGRLRVIGSPVVVILLILVSVITGRTRAIEIEEYRYFVSATDIAAMDWISANTPTNARFAINVTFWFPNLPHGTDAGYWIPYFTGRPTTAGSMLINFSSISYREWILEASRAIERLMNDPSAIDDLRRLGVDYIYIGAQGDFSGSGLDGPRLSQLSGIHPVYHKDQVWVLQLEK